MPRQARIVLPGYLHHVTQRGNYRQNIFNDDIDRITYLKLLEHYGAKYGVSLYAFCLMDNHLHLIVSPSDPGGLGKAFCRIQQRYSIYFHKRVSRRGHLWQERFYSCLLFGAHIARAIRYIEKNPVRARMVEKPWDYRWSSARAHLGTKYKIITLADVKEIVNVESWREFLEEDEKDEDIDKLRKSTLKGGVFGPVEFVKKLEEKLGRSILKKTQGRPKILNKSKGG